MSPKELLYIQDALSHEQHMKTKLNECVSQIQDAELKTFVQQLATKHQEAFGKFFQLL